MNYKIGIVGLGLIGASIAKATKAYTHNTVFGYDIDEKTMEKAISEGTIDRELDVDSIPELDLLLLAVNPSVAIKFVKENPNIKGILIDLCGIKQVVSDSILPISKLRGFTYIGGHPMAGSQLGGYDNSSADLFDGASMVLVPHEGNIPIWLYNYFLGLKFNLIKTTTDSDHDRVIAYTSQLAHIVSNALVKSKTSMEHEGLSADSLKDLTRVATLDADMWSELFLGNKENLSREVSYLIEELEKYKDAIDSDDEEELKRLLVEGVESKSKMYP